MKHCPNCLATYEDDSQTYCTNEGTRLVTGSPPRPQQTILAPSQGSGDLTSSSNFFRSGGSASNWSGSSPSLGSQKPWSTLSADAPQPPPRRSNMLLVALGCVALMVVGLVVGIMLANRNATADGQTTTEQRGAAEVKPDALLTELKDTEGKITEANIKGDKPTLERLLNDDYVAVAADGKVYNKAQTLASMEPAEGVASWSIDGARLLTYGKDSATLTGIITFKANNLVERQQFTDSFVKRDGRWQAFASQSTVLK